MSQTPMEDTIREKVTTSLNPSELEIYNDSHRHAHHAAMRNSQSAETHFRVVVVSEAFRGKSKMAKHRMVYGLLKEEMARAGGIHSLQLTTQDPPEETTVNTEQSKSVESIDALVEKQAT